MPPGKSAGCSNRCRTAAWAAARPRVKRIERNSNEPAKAVILGLMLDYQWRTVRMIATATGISERTAGIKLRSLRECGVCGRVCELHPAPFVLHKRLLEGTREYEFQLQRPKEART